MHKTSDTPKPSAPKTGDPISCIWHRQRANLATAAVYIYDSKLKAVQKASQGNKPLAIKTVFPRLYRKVESFGQNSSGRGDDFPTEVFNLYRDCRYYLCHTKHKAVEVSADMRKFLKYIYSEGRSCKKPIALAKQEKGVWIFTIEGMLYFLCLGLERKRAYELLGRFYDLWEVGDEDEKQNIKKTFAAHSVKESFNVAHHRYDSDYTWWQLFCEILSHIRKPLPLALAAMGENTEDDVRTENRYMVDYFILRWLKLGEFLPNLEFARSIPHAANNKSRMKNYPFFEDDEKMRSYLDALNAGRAGGIDSRQSEHRFEDREYYRHNDQYWCRLRTDKEGRGEEIIFKLHRDHLRTIAELLLAKQECAGEITTAIEESLAKMPSAESIGGEHSEALHASLPRNWRRDWERAELTHRKGERLKQYDAAIIKAKPIGRQAQFILWALQHPLNPDAEKEGKESGKLFTDKYQKANSAICYYVDNPDFQKRVRAELRKYMRVHVQATLPKTIDYLCGELTKIDYSKASNKRHKFRENDPQKSKHWLEKRDKSDIIWLPKNCFTDLQKWQKGQKLKSHKWLDPKNYHADLSSDTASDTDGVISYQSNKEDKVHRSILNRAISAYAQDVLLLKIALFVGKKWKVMGDSLNVLKVEFAGTLIPIKHLGKAYIQRDEEKFKSGLDIARKKLEEKGKEPSGEALLKCFFEYVEPCYSNVAHLILQKLFEIEVKAIKQHKLKPGGKKHYVEFRIIANVLCKGENTGDNEKLKSIRNTCLHGDIFTEQERQEDIEIIDRVAKKLGLKRTLSELMQDRKENKQIRKQEYSRG